jgi:hypothetical protein
MLLIHGANMKKVTEQFERELDETGPSVKWICDLHSNKMRKDFMVSCYGDACKWLDILLWYFLKMDYTALRLCSDYAEGVGRVPAWKGTLLLLQTLQTGFWAYRTPCSIGYLTNFTFTWPCILTNFFTIKPTRCTNFTNLFWHETLHVYSSSDHHQEFIHCKLSNDICHTVL